MADRSADISVAELGVKRMGLLLNELGNPQLDYQTIHIAGSKGKGTTTYLTSAVLSAAGLRTGRYVSPHLFSWNERIAIDGVSISDADFAGVLEVVDDQMSQIETARPDLGAFNAFELLTSAAFQYFSVSGCDAAIIEVGLGGRFDSTNHLAPASIILTTIEDEHAEILGPDLTTIAWNKAGIMRAGVTTVVQRQSGKAWNVIKIESDKKQITTLLEDRDWFVRGERTIEVEDANLELSDLELRLPGSTNASNLAAGLIAINQGFPDIELSRELVNRAIEGLDIPGRFTILHHPKTGQVFVLDGAHTVQSLNALGKAIQAHFGIDRTLFVINLLDDKPLDQVFTVISAFADEVMFPPASSIRASQPEILLAAAISAGIRATVATSLPDCLWTTRSDGYPVIVTGSFGIVSEAISILSDSTTY